MAPPSSKDETIHSIRRMMYIGRYTSLTVHYDFGLKDEPWSCQISAKPEQFDVDYKAAMAKAHHDWQIGTLSEKGFDKMKKLLNEYAEFYANADFMAETMRFVEAQHNAKMNKFKAELAAKK